MGFQHVKGAVLQPGISLDRAASEQLRATSWKHGRRQKLSAWPFRVQPECPVRYLQHLDVSLAARPSMAHDPAASLQIFSPTGSGRSSPSPRVTRSTAEETLHKNDKTFRRYAAGIDRALALWDTAQQEWADYISFLGRLLKALQAHPAETPVIPHSSAVALRLSQCLNPTLPSGVHQKALEVYGYIFATIGVRSHPRLGLQLLTSSPERCPCP